tara:strand:- start:482 stop:862 length:381 start_codon:yes stop_codon:yes gene_type:complete
MRISDVGSVNNVVSIPNSSDTAVDKGHDVAAAELVGQAGQVKDEQGQQEVVINDEMLDKSIEQANKTLENYNRYIERSVHEKTKAIMYVMKDSTTNEVIREFPPRKIQDMIAKMWELAGLFVDEKA